MNAKTLHALKFTAAGLVGILIGYFIDRKPDDWSHFVQFAAMAGVLMFVIFRFTPPFRR